MASPMSAIPETSWYMYFEQPSSPRFYIKNRTKLASQTYKQFIKLKQRKSQPWLLRFGYLVLISTDFDNFTSPFTP